VHTGVHYPSDVIVGSAFGVAAGLIGARVVRRMRARSIQRVDAAAIDVAVPRTAVLVTSADSGSADGLQAAQDELAAAGWRIAEVVDVADCDGLPARLRETADPPLVIAAGGDGTVCAALNAMHETDALLAIVPLGTSNDVARSLGIPPDPVEAVRVIAGGRVCRIDAAVVSVDGSGERSFLNAATVGLNVTFAREATDARLRRQFGKLAYPVAAARALRRYEPFECDLDLDGRAECRRAVHVSISNAPVFGGLLGMRVPNASITDGLLDVSVVERLSLARLTLAVIDNFVGRHRPVHRVHTWQARSVRLRSSSAQEIAMDGEVLGKLPAEFEVRAGAVRVVVPPN
jgi:YegS/Rv2252/BmrU family lipid kinase